ncbi:MAG: DUF1080 domain-containing protein [Phycisphaera sp.]|nr:DUF1080 domain-containing protein [Phycisphaera sp.]
MKTGHVNIVRGGIGSLVMVAAVASMASVAWAGPFTDPQDPKLPADFKFQGEYATGRGTQKLGCQVIALDHGKFQAVILPGGLPGAGWDGQNKSLMQGSLEGDKVVFVPATGSRKYLADSPDEFSATRKFPPVGQKEIIGVIEGGVLTLGADGAKIELNRVERKSPTMGATPPAGATVLFSGKADDLKNFNGGRFDEKTGFLNTDGQDIRTKEKYMNYTMHVEFMEPYKPEGRGQGRGNSGFYQVDHYEVQILDSFGLDGVDNECGGIYHKVTPKVNMCLPPLQWQTYDVDFTNAVQKDGQKVAKARITVKLNGVVIHDNVEIDGPTGGHRGDPEGTPGPIKLQGHGNPLQFRNVWIVPKD